MKLQALAVSLAALLTLTKISPNFLLWKFFGNSQFRMIRSKLRGNFAFPQNFHTGKLGELRYFMQCGLREPSQVLYRRAALKKGKSYEKHLFWSAISVA